MRISVLVCCVSGLFAFSCTGTENEQCTEHSAKFHSEALSLRLTKNGVAHVVKTGQVVCFAAKDAAKVEKASREIAEYFYEVARGLADACEEKALVAWATAEKLKFDVFDTFDADRKPTGRRLFTIFSMSESDRDLNQRKLWNEAPRGIRCTNSNSK